VRENLEMGAYHSGAWKHRKETLKRVYKLFPRLEEREHKLSRTLSGGERQMLAIGRALMARPTLCAFDEPSIGLSPLLVDEFFHIIKQVREEASRCCWWNRMFIKAWRSQTAHTSWKMDASPWKETAATCWKMNASARLTWDCSQVTTNPWRMLGHAEPSNEFFKGAAHESGTRQ